MSASSPNVSDATADDHGPKLHDQLYALSSAEDFFAFFQIDYDEGVLRVCRLHIMKRMGQYLNECDFTNLHDDEIYLEARQRLERAYADFVTSTPRQERVFAVLARAGEAERPGFVKLDELRGPSA
ncbi:MAG: nitrogenase stabilizing/protective protein NifW [Pseudomonadota bacterium]